MRNFLLFMLAGFITAGQSNATLKDTTILGVRVYHNVPSATAFPREWLGSPISASSEMLANNEIRRSQDILYKALQKYPLPLMELNCKAVYFFRSMTFYKVGFGGTNVYDAIYISNYGLSMGYSDLYLEQNMHHELSSIFLRNYMRFFDSTAWNKVNPPGFRYKDPEGGVGAIRNNQSSLLLDSQLAAKGFLTEYACSDLENDVNMIAQHLFMPSPGFWEMADKYTRIYKKVTLLIAFYNKLYPLFTEEYFRAFNK